MFTKVITLLALLAGSTFASPVEAVPELAKRGGESVHLVNCADSSSRMFYYSNDGNYAPADQTTVTRNGLVTWEGNTVRGYFSSSGVTFTSNIQKSAQSYKNYAFAGTGNNGKPFNCYKDDQHTINNTGCTSIYYCFPA